MNALSSSSPASLASTALADSVAEPIATGSLLPQLLAAAALGAVVLYAVAFAPSMLAHNAAHDVRHFTATPCH